VAIETHIAEVLGIKMRWLEQGTGVPVVMLHGVPTSPELWREVMPRVEGARCLAWELVGHGQSIPQGRGRDISLAAQADYLAAWIDHLGLSPVILAGHDLGGGVAQLAAASYPGMCAGLFLTNSVGYGNWPVPSVRALQATRAAMRFMPAAAFKQFLRSFFLRGHVTWPAAEDSLGQHWPHYALNGGASAFARQVKALRKRDTLAVADDLPGLAIPARVAWGADDVFLKIKYGERFARDLAAPLRRIEGGKHFTPVDFPEVLAEEINALVRAVRERDAG
jgi:pimeloyl-ACP methyl ester carboxylesterase